MANGDLSKKITVDVRGEMLAMKDTINTMVDQLNSFGFEVTRGRARWGPTASSAASAGRRGERTWKDLTDSVNGMASNLTAQVQHRPGDDGRGQRRPVEEDHRRRQGEILEPEGHDQHDGRPGSTASLRRSARGRGEVGTDGKLGGQSGERGVAKVWKDLTDSVNGMASNLTAQVCNIALVTTAVANGDLSKKITVDVRGEMLAMKATINTMVDQLNSFASEVAAGRKEVGTEGSSAARPGSRASRGRGRT